MLYGMTCKNRLKPHKKKWHAMNTIPGVAEVKNKVFLDYDGLNGLNGGGGGVGPHAGCRLKFSTFVGCR